jgi:hypothetical protein
MDLLRGLLGVDHAQLVARSIKAERLARSLSGVRLRLCMLASLVVLLSNLL